MRKGNFSGPEVKENVFIFRSICISIALVKKRRQ